MKIDESGEKSGLFDSEWVEDRYGERDAGDVPEAPFVEKHPTIYTMKMKKARIKAPECPTCSNPVVVLHCSDRQVGKEPSQYLRCLQSKTKKGAGGKVHSILLDPVKYKWGQNGVMTSEMSKNEGNFK